MNAKHAPAAFPNPPLIAAEDIEGAGRQWHRLFGTRPGWASRATFLHGRVFIGLPTPNDPSYAPHMPPMEFGLLCTLTLFGHTVYANERAAAKGAPAYLKLSFRGAADANVTVRRLISGASEGMSCHALEIERDYSAANIHFRPDPRAKRDARIVAKREAGRLAAEVMGMAYDVDAYLAVIDGYCAKLDRPAAEH